MGANRRVLSTVLCLIFFFSSTFAFQLIEFKSLPSSITTNINAFPVTGIVPSTTKEVFINDVNTAFSSFGYDFFGIVDLQQGINTITLKVIDKSGTQNTYSKQITYNQNYSTEDSELVYGNAIHYVGSVLYFLGTIVIDLKEGTFLGIIKERNIVGISKDGKEMLLEKCQNTSQSNSCTAQRYSTKTNSFLGFDVPKGFYYYDYPNFLYTSNNKLYYSNVKFDLATNTIEGYLPAGFGVDQAGNLSSDEKKIYAPNGFVELATNAFTGKDYIQGCITYPNNVVADPQQKYIFQSSYGWAAGRLAILNINEGNVLKSYNRGDFAGDTVFSPDGKKAYTGFHGNTYYGGGGIQVTDLATLNSNSYFGLHGAESLAVSKSGKIYAPAVYTKNVGVQGKPDVRGIIELNPINSATELQINKVYFANLTNSTNQYSPKGIFYKEGKEPACTVNSDCGVNGFVGETTCSGNDVYQTYRSFSCAQGTCSSSDSLVLKKDCGETTYGNWGANYCEGNNVARKRIVFGKGCDAGTCTSNQTEEKQTVQICKDSCSNGMCNSITKPAGTGNVRVAGRNLYVNNQEYKIKGVGYDPVPIGMNPDWGYDVTVHPELTARDFPILREMGANTIRTWGKVNSVSFLDAAWNGGSKPIRVIMGYWMGSEKDYEARGVRQTILADFNEYVKKYKDHPAVLTWAVGNEENHFYAGGNTTKLKAYFSLVNEMARNAYAIEGTKYHPVTVISLEMPGEMNTVGNAAGGADDESIPFVDMWGINYYPGKSFGNFFNNYESKTTKPLIVSEYGIDALNNETKLEQEQVQADWEIALWREINSSSVAVGGTLMAYIDEWWKDYAGDVSTHDYGGYATSSHPDGYANEEWWGIIRLSEGNVIAKRKAYYAFQKEFSGTTTICTTNMDCGEDSWINNPTCQNGNVYQNYKTYTCNNPGTVQAKCTNSTVLKMVETCQFGCTNGTCDATQGTQVFYETFDSLDSIKNNGGIFNPASSVFETGFIGNALHFKNKEAITYPLGLSQINKGTIEFLFKKIGNFYGLIELDSNGGWAKNNPYIMSFVNYNKVWIEVGGVGQYQSKEIKDNKWHHVALVWECKASGGSVKLYVDGKLGTRNDWPGKCKVDFNAPLVLKVGMSEYYGPGESVFDELKIYNKVQSESTIKKHYNYYLGKKICYTNSDCGKDVWTGKAACESGNVYQNYKTYTCNNSGTQLAACTNNTTLTLKESCSYKCYKSACVMPFVLDCPVGEIDKNYTFNWGKDEYNDFVIKFSYTPDFNKNTYFSVDKDGSNKYAIKSAYSKLLAYQGKSVTGQIYAKVKGDSSSKAPEYSNVCAFTVKQVS